MGQVESQPSYYKQIQIEDGNFVIVTNDPIEQIEFNSSHSYMVSYGIDRQTNPKFKHKTLSSITGKDAKLVSKSLVEIGVFPPQNTALYVASKQTEECTFAGIKKTFQESAAKVGAEGLLVFHFSGHGINVRKTNEWGLAPSDFDKSDATLLTASTLIDWVNETNCQAKHILFTLDCCYAGGIGKELTRSVEVKINSSIYVISACADSETSLVIGSLRNSIFSYFLSNAIQTCSNKVGILPIKNIFSLCKVCCESLSSLLLRYKFDALRPSLMQPQMGALHLQSFVPELPGKEEEDQIDAAIGRFAFAFSMYDSKWSNSQLSEKSIAYLETVSSLDDGPLIQLEQNGVMTQRVLDAALCSMMYSVAAIELIDDKKNVQNPNHSITAFINCVAAIDMVHSASGAPVEFSELMFFVSWLFYREVLVENEVNCSNLQPLFQKLQSICQQNTRVSRELEDSFHVAADSTESTDYAAVFAAEATFRVSGHPKLHRWIPITDSDL